MNLNILILILLLTFLSSFDLMPAMANTLSERKVTTEVMGSRIVDRREIVGTVCIKEWREIDDSKMRGHGLQT